MNDSIEKLCSKQYFPEISNAFLGNKKFHIVVRNKNPDYSFAVNSYSLYNFASKNNGATAHLNQFSLKHHLNLGSITLHNRYRPNKEVHFVNAANLDMGKAGTLELLQTATRSRGLNSLALKHRITKDAFSAKSSFKYNAEDQGFDLSAYIGHSLTTNWAKNSFLSSLTHTGGLSWELNLNSLRLKSFDMFYHLLLEKHQFLLAHITKDPTIDNFWGTFIFGYIKKSSDNVKTIIKMVHDYQTKESNIDLVRESHITEKAIIRNKITSGYNIGTSLTYNINDNIRICHSAEADLRKFFKMEENYKYGIKLEVDI